MFGRVSTSTVEEPFSLSALAIMRSPSPNMGKEEPIQGSIVNTVVCFPPIEVCGLPGPQQPGTWAHIAPDRFRVLDPGDLPYTAGAPLNRLEEVPCRFF